MTLTESLEKVKEFLERINVEVYKKDFKMEECKVEIDVDDYIAIKNIYTELKHIQETILKLGWNKINGKV